MCLAFTMLTDVYASCRKRTVCLAFMMLTDIYASSIAVVEGVNLRKADELEGDAETRRNLLLLAASTASSVAAVLWSAFEQRGMQALLAATRTVRASATQLTTRMQLTRVQPSRVSGTGSRSRVRAPLVCSPQHRSTVNIGT